MPVTPEDRRRWERQVASLRDVETDEEPSAEAMERVVAAANGWRNEHDIAELQPDDHDLPEEEFFRRARALGMRFSRS